MDSCQVGLMMSLGIVWSVDSRCVTIWRECNTFDKPKSICEKHRYKDGGIIVWAGIILNGYIDLYILTSATMNAEIYRDKILDIYVKLFRVIVSNNFLLMDYNILLPPFIMLHYNWLSENKRTQLASPNSPLLHSRSFKELFTMNTLTAGIPGQSNILEEK